MSIHSPWLTESVVRHPHPLLLPETALSASHFYLPSSLGSEGCRDFVSLFVCFCCLFVCFCYLKLSVQYLSGHLFMSQVSSRAFCPAGSITAVINSHQRKQVYLQEHQLCFLVPLFCLGSANGLQFQCVPFQCALPHIESSHAWMPVPGAAGHPVDWVRHRHPATLGKGHL